MSKIKVIDEPCGKGKTSFSIQMMNDNQEKSFIYCTPLLNEIDRIKKNTKAKFCEPNNYESTKIEDFNTLLMEGRNIAVTHCTFANSNDNTLEYLKQGHYTLILDEVLDILVDFNSVAKDNLSKSDIRVLFNEGFIKTDEYGKVYWLKESYPNSKYYNVERIAKNGNLYYLDNSMMVWQFPPQIFNAFDKVYILTFLFNGSFLQPYLKYHHIDYEINGVESVNNHYQLKPYESDLKDRQKYKNLITIYENSKANNYRASSLCKSWFEKQKTNQLKTLQNNIFNYFHNITKAKSKDIMWTCPQDFIKNLKGSGYNITRKLTPREQELTKTEKTKLEKKLSCYVPLNARATNDFKDRSVLAYVYNFYPNPYIKRYFENKNKTDGTNIGTNQEYLALSCLIQWIWRSQIRDGKPIKIYIPSERMRTLLVNWLDGKM